MGESKEKLIKAIKHYQDSLERHTKTGNAEKLNHAIEKLARLPIKVCHLEETGVGRTVNGLKRFDGSVGENARSLVDKWKSMVKGEEEKERVQEEQELPMEQEVVEDEPDPASLQIIDPEENNPSDKESVEINNSSPKKSSSNKNSHNSSSGSSRHSNSDKRSRSPDRQKYKRDDSSDNNSDSNMNNTPKKRKSDKSDVKLKKSSHKSHSEEESSSSESDDSDSSRESSPRRTKDKRKSGRSRSESSDSEQSSSEDSSSDDDEKHKLKNHRTHKKRHSSSSQSDSDTKSSDKPNKIKEKSSKHTKSSSENDRDHKNKHSQSKEKHSDSKEHSSKARDKSKDTPSKSHNTKSDRRDKDRESSSKKDCSSVRSKSKSDENESKHKHTNSEKEKSKHRDSDKDLRHSSSKSEEKKKEELKKESSKSSKENGKNTHDKKRSREPSTESDAKRRKDEPAETKDSKRKSNEPSSASKPREKETSDKKKDSGSKKDKDKDTKKSRDSSSSSKSSKDKEKPKTPKISNSSTKQLLTGIDSGSGTSFADVLGMLEAPVYTKSKKKSTGLEEKHTSERSSTSAKEDRPPKSRSSAEGSSIQDNEGVPNLLQDPSSLEPLDINISSLLPSITPNYRPLGLPVDSHNKKMWSDDEALTRVITAKHQRTKVYSGNKCSYTKLPTLFDICSRVLQDNLDALEYTGGVPYSILKHILEKANPDQLYQLEFHNPYLIEDTDELWQLHCQKEFRNKKREELESWREMYMRCLDEREAKLKALTANIKQSQEKYIPVRQTKLAYVDSVVKPPRNIARKQAKNGTAVEIKKPSQTPTERLNQLAKAGEAAKTAVPNPGRAAADRSSSSSHNSNLKPKKAPLMAKTLSLLKNRFGRR